MFAFLPNGTPRESTHVRTPTPRQHIPNSLRASLRTINIPHWSSATLIVP